MRLTCHARTRGQQRRVTPEAIDLALTDGDIRKGWGGAEIYRLTDRALRGLGADFDRLRGVEVVAIDGTIVTVWKNSNRRRRARGRHLREAVRLREVEAAWLACQDDELHTTLI